MYELNKHNEPIYAREIAEELDVSSKLISRRAKKLDEDKGYVERVKTSPMTYRITKSAKITYFDKKN